MRMTKRRDPETCSAGWGRWLRGRVDESGVQMKAIALKSGVDIATISRFFNDVATPPFPRVADILIAFGELRATSRTRLVAA